MIFQDDVESFKQWLINNRSNGHNPEIILWIGGYWTIWKQRNDYVFRNEQLDRNGMKRRMEAKVAMWNSASHSATTINPGSVQMTKELEGRIQVKSDCLEVVNAVKATTTDWPWEYGVIIADIQPILHEHLNISISHCRRTEIAKAHNTSNQARLGTLIPNWGCDASLLIDPTPQNPQPQRTAPPNKSIRRFNLIDVVKSVVDGGSCNKEEESKKEEEEKKKKKKKRKKEAIPATAFAAFVIDRRLHLCY
ncbi:hypothetical protein LINPERHAP2_LOCUS15263 [Linum perenne]